MNGHEDHSAGVVGKLPHTHWLVIGIKADVVDPVGAKIRMEVGVAVLRREATRRIPCSANRTVPAKLWPRDGRSGSADIYHSGVIAAKNIGASGSPDAGPQFGGNCSIG